jgi:hypothetical protein
VTSKYDKDKPTTCGISGCEYEMRGGDSYTEHMAVHHPHAWAHILFSSFPKRLQGRILYTTRTFYDNPQE